MEKFFRTKKLTKVAFVLAGALGGYAYYYFIGCASGTCPISSNPYVSTLYGAMIGFTLSIIKEE